VSIDATTPVSECDFASGAATLHRVLGECGWAVWIGLQHPGLLKEAISLCPRLLVIQPNTLFAERLRDEWPAGLPPGLLISPVVLASQQEVASWYCYNDRRLDGTLSPEDLCTLHPNLSLLRQEFRRSTALDEVVNGWWGEDATPPAENGCLILQSHDLSSVLEGAESLLDHLDNVVCWVEDRGGTEAAPMPVGFVSRLQEASFRRSASDPFIWERDAQRMLQGELELGRAELARLRTECEAQSLTLQAKDLELDSLSARILLADLERDHLKADVEAMREHWIDAQTNAELQEQRRHQLESLLADQHQRVADLDNALQQLRVQAIVLESQRDLLQQSYDNHLNALDQNAQQRAELQARLQGLEENCAARQVSLENLQVEHQTLQAEAAQIRQERDSFRAGHDLAVDQRNQLDAQLRIKEGSCHDLETQLAAQQRREADLEDALRQLQHQATALERQRDQLQQSHESQQTALDQNAQQRAELQAQRQGLEENSAALLVSLENLQVEHQTLQAEAAQIRQERDSFRAGHDLAVDQRNQLDAELKILRAEHDDLRRREQQLARLTDDSEQQLAMIRDLFVQLSAARDLPG
jgi:chromosome segregation ATPase